MKSIIGFSIRKKFIFAVFAVLLSLPFMFHTTYAQQANDTVIIATEAEVPNLDPGQLIGLHSARASRLIFENLVAPKPTTTEIVPQLATSWSVTSNGLEWTFKLRSGVKFHDGTPFNAQAVKYTIDRVMNRSHPANKWGKWSFIRGYLAPVKEVVAVDPLTVKFILKFPNATFLSYLAMPNLGIISPTAQKKLKKDFATRPVGTGLYQFGGWQRGVKLTLTRNESHWGRKGKAKTIIFRPIAEDQTRVAELLSGGVDVITNVIPDALALLKKNPNTSIIRQPGLTLWYVALNTKKKPFSDVRVRRALNYAIDRLSIVRDVLKNTGQPATQFVPPASWGYAPDARKYTYDPVRAKKLLSAAGYPNGFSTTFWVPNSGSGMQLPKEMATVIQANLAAVGVKVKIEIFEWGSYFGKLRKERANMAAFSWFLKSEDPDIGLFPMINSRTSPFPNLAQYQNPVVDKLFRQGRALTDTAKRKPIYQKIVKILNEDAPHIVVDHQVEIVGIRSNLKGLTVNPNGFSLGLETAYHQ
jgi:peptide/nickel transport system substrate-binding protein